MSKNPDWKFPPQDEEQELHSLQDPTWQSTEHHARGRVAHFKRHVPYPLPLPTWTILDVALLKENLYLGNCLFRDLAKRLRSDLAQHHHALMQHQIFGFQDLVCTVKLPPSLIFYLLWIQDPTPLVLVKYTIM